MKNRKLLEPVYRITPYVITAFITFAYLSFYTHYFFLTNPANAEQTMISALRILHGQMIYRDFFDVFFPGNTYLLAGLYKIFGSGIIVTNEITIVMSCVINILLYHFSRLVIKRWYAILAPLLFLTFGFTEWFTFTHYITAAIILLLTLAFLNQFFSSGKDIFLYVSGFLAGLTTVFLQSTGVYTIVILTILLLWIPEKFFKNAGKAVEGRSDKHVRLSIIIKFVIGAGIPLLFMLLFLIVNRAVYGFLRDEYILLSAYPKIDMFLMSPFASVKYIVDDPIRLFQVITALLSVFMLIRRKAGTSIEYILFSGSIIFFLNNGHRLMLIIPTTTYINMGLSMVFGVYLIYLFDDMLQKKSWKLLYNKLFKRGINAVISACMVVVFAMLFFSVKKIQEKGYHFILDHERLWTFDRYGAETMVNFIAETDRIIKNDRKVFVYPIASILYSVMDIQNPTSYDLVPSLGTVSDTPSFVMDQIIRQLKASKTKYIITYQWSYIGFQHIAKEEGKHFSINKLEKYMFTHYKTVKVAGKLKSGYFYVLLKHTDIENKDVIKAISLIDIKLTASNNMIQNGDNIYLPNIIGQEQAYPGALNIIVLGAIQKPGRIFLNKGARFMNIFNIGDSPLPISDLRNVIIIREKKIIRINLLRYIRAHDNNDNPLLENNDIIYMPKTGEVIDKAHIIKEAHNLSK